MKKKDYINISKAKSKEIQIGINYLRTMQKEQAMKLIKKTYNELENKKRKNKDKEIAILMTKKNWEYYNTFEPELKYSLLITAGKLSKINNPQKDQFK